MPSGSSGCSNGYVALVDILVCREWNPKSPIGVVAEKYDEEGHLGCKAVDKWPESICPLRLEVEEETVRVPIVRPQLHLASSAQESGPSGV